jgi:L-asparaginase
VRIALRPVRRHKIALPESSPNHPVALLKIALGDEGRLLSAVERQGYEELVIEALGGGHIPSVMVGALEELAGKMPVILASRIGSGEVLSETYGFAGSETDLLGRGLISAGSLDGLKARLFRTLLLKAGATRQEISYAFDC